MRTATRVLTAILAVVAGLVAAPATASAAPGDVVVRHAYRNTGSNSECFGKRGTFKVGTHIVLVDWDNNRDWDECFGIAPDRRIYHAYRTSAGWDPMPGNGRADEVQAPFLYQGRYHTITVYVTPVDRYYCASLIGNWRPWAPCAPRSSDAP